MFPLSRSLPLLAFAAAFACCCPLPGSTDSALAWEQTLIREKAGAGTAIVEAWFTFTNESDALVEVIGVDSDCDCIVARLDKSRYYPGEYGLLLASLSLSEGREPVRKTVQVTTLSKGITSITELVILVDRTGAAGAGAGPPR
jgi:hypothetical protein